MVNVTRYDLNQDLVTGELFISPVPESMEGRYVSYEDYAELQQKLDAMADKLARSEDYSVGVDAERMEHIKKCNALAAENASLKTFINQSCYSYDGDGSDVSDSYVDASESPFFPKTPATDAYLNSVRAEAICSAIAECTDHCDTDCVMEAYDLSYEIAEMRSSGAIDLHDALVVCANQLRYGTHDAADKAG